MSELQAGTIAPEIGTIVNYGINEIMKEPRRYRVTAWIREAPPPTFDPEDALDQILYESSREFRDAVDGVKKRMQFCLREEATHLSLTGVGGAIAPIALCTVIGKVEWPQNLLDDALASALRLGQSHQIIY